MILFSVFLPTRFNDGSIVPNQFYEKLEGEFLERFGGLSKFRSQGGWIYESKQYREESWKYEIMTNDPDIAGIRNYLAELKKRLMRDLRQHDVLITITDIDIIT